MRPKTDKPEPKKEKPNKSTKKRKQPFLQTSWAQLDLGFYDPTPD